MSSDPMVPPDTVTVILDHVLQQSPTLGSGHLVCVDGPAGSGKTTLADAIAARSRRLVPSVRLLHMDDLYPGWNGLGAVAEMVRHELITPLASGAVGSYRRWDWAASSWAEQHLVDPVSLLVIEGVGSGALEYAEQISTLVWVDADWDLRLNRGVERDGEAMRQHWEAWQVAETEHFTRQRTRERADVLVDGHGQVVSAPSH